MELKLRNLFEMVAEMHTSGSIADLLVPYALRRGRLIKIIQSECLISEDFEFYLSVDPA